MSWGGIKLFIKQRPSFRGFPIYYSPVADVESHRRAGKLGGSSSNFGFVGNGMAAAIRSNGTEQSKVARCCKNIEKPLRL